MLSRSSLKYFSFAIVAILIGLGVGWFASGPSVKPSARHETDPVEIPTAQPSQSSPSDGAETSAPNPTKTEVIAVAPIAAPNWEDSINDILANNFTDTDEKAVQLLNALTNMPEAGQIEAVQHLSNLLESEHYERMGKLLTDSKTAPAVSDALLADLYNRPGSIRLPVLIEVARNPQHPKAAEAREHLTQVLEEDFGQDWHRWQTQSEQWIQANPD